MDNDDDGLDKFGFERDPRYNSEPLPRWMGRPRRRRDDGYHTGQVHRILTDDPEDARTA